MSEIERHLESILVADCGSATTKVVLLDVVDAQYRFVARAEVPSTVNSPWRDILIGVVQAVRELEETTGRTFLDQDNQLITPERADGRGVDRFLALSSAAEPLRVVLVGLVSDVSLASARRAALATYAMLEQVIAFQQIPGQDRPHTLDDDINAIWHSSPDVICVVGGTDGGAAKPVLEMMRNVVRVALYLKEDKVPSVIYAGNAQLREAVAKQLGDLAFLQVVDNVRPVVDAENIGPAHEEMEVIFYEQKMRHIPGIDAIKAWSPSAVLPTARAQDYTIRYCEQAWRSSKAALGVDIGSASVTLNVCQNSQPLTTIRTDLGMGHALHGLLEQVEMRDILRWLPFRISESEARDRLLNKAHRPYTVPQTREDLLLEQAAAREMLRLALSDSLPGWPGCPDTYLQEDQTGPVRYDCDTLMIPPCDPIIASGGVFAHSPYQGYTVLMLLDALQPTGISTIYLDEYNLVAALGTVANIEPLATVQVLHNEGITRLGTVVVPIGHAKPGEKVLTIRPVDKRSSMSSDVTYGDLETIPFQFFEPGTMLELIPARHFDIGRGPGKSIKIQHKGGSVGLIVDARGRPLEIDDDAQVQRQRMDHWLWEMMSA